MEKIQSGVPVFLLAMVIVLGVATIIAIKNITTINSFPGTSYTADGKIIAVTRCPELRQHCIKMKYADTYDCVLMRMINQA